MTSPLGHRTRYEWDPLNQLTRIVDPLQGATQLTYDPNGNLTGVQDAKGNLTQYAPDNMDRVLTRADALLHEARVLFYDEHGNPRQVRDRKGQVTQTTYDPLNRPKVVTWADTSTTTLTWDGGNRLTQLVDTISGMITRNWDDLDRLSYEQTPQGRVDYTYDDAGRRQTMTVQGQPAVVYDWDDADRLKSLTQGAAVVLLGYDDANRRTTITYPNGILATYAYNARDLTGITFTKGMATLGTLTYTTDADGRRTLGGGTWARTTLPPALTSAVYNANNQQVNFGATVLTYDLNGNLATAGGAAYTWDARDRLTVATPDPVSQATFQYDPLGRRTRKSVGPTTTRFHYDGVTPVQELDGTGGILANLLTGLGIDEYFTRSDSTGTRTLLGDALNSTLALANNAGTVRTTYTYEPFGTASATGQANANPYQYTGRENDGTGLHYYRARYYSPARQRFISEDPIGFAGGDPNLYEFVGNSPLSLVDPLGLDAWDDAANLSAGFGDTISLGGTAWIRGLWTRQFGLPDVVDLSSGWNLAGRKAAYAYELTNVAMGVVGAVHAIRGVVGGARAIGRPLLTALRDQRGALGRFDANFDANQDALNSARQTREGSRRSNG